MRVVGTRREEKPATVVKLAALRVRLRRLCPASLTTVVRVSGDRAPIVDWTATLTVRDLYGTLVRSEEALWQRERNESRLESHLRITAV